ncbi:hypothetical protein [Burkholderia lata]|nr:hypothetical protein [Burkholderia lata]
MKDRQPGLQFIAWIALRRGVDRPLGLAHEAAGRLAAGDLTRQLAVQRSDVIGATLDSLNGINSGLTKLFAGVHVATGTIHLAAGEVAAGDLDLSRRTEEQAASLQQTAASMTELAQTVRQNAERAR